jgi:hypothetical protein
MRWWSLIKDDGTEEWKFESFEDKTWQPDRIDSSVFWSSQIGVTVLYGFLLFINIISIDLIDVKIVKFILLDYAKCSRFRSCCY